MIWIVHASLAGISRLWTGAVGPLLNVGPEILAVTSRITVYRLVYISDCICRGRTNSACIWSRCIYSKQLSIEHDIGKLNIRLLKLLVQHQPVELELRTLMLNSTIRLSMYLWTVELELHFLSINVIRVGHGSVTRISGIKYWLLTPPSRWNQGI